MTTLKSSLIGQHVASSTRTAMFWGNSSNVPDDPIMSSFLLILLLMNIKENIFKSEECKSLAAALQGGFLWKTACWKVRAGRRNAQRHLHVTINRDLLGLHYNSRVNQSCSSLWRMPSTPQQQCVRMHSQPFIQNCSRAPCPGPLSATLLYSATALAVHFNWRQTGK